MFDVRVFLLVFVVVEFQFLIKIYCLLAQIDINIVVKEEKKNNKQMTFSRYPKPELFQPYSDQLFSIFIWNFFHHYYATILLIRWYWFWNESHHQSVDIINCNKQGLYWNHDNVNLTLFWTLKIISWNQLFLFIPRFTVVSLKEKLRLYRKK